MAGTTWHTITANTYAKAQDVEDNFDWIEGHLMPQIAGSQTNSVYDLGSSSYRWSTIYCQSINISSTTRYVVYPTFGMQYSSTYSSYRLKTVQIPIGSVISNFRWIYANNGSQTASAYFKKAISSSDLVGVTVTTLASIVAGSLASTLIDVNTNCTCTITEDDIFYINIDISAGSSYACILTYAVTGLLP